MADVRAIQGDCLEIMPTLPAASVSLIVGDCPYHRVKDDDWDRQWKTDADYLGWIGWLCGEFRRVLRPNGSLYVFASPRMAARVECKVGETFAIVNRITWRKPAFATKAEMFVKDDLRGYFPASEAIIFAEQVGSDSAAMGGAGWDAKCEEVRGFVFEPLRAYLRAEMNSAGLVPRDINRAVGSSLSGGGMASHYVGETGQWELPTPGHYARIRAIAPGHFRREYEDLRREYEDLRRPFSVDESVPYTDVWDFPTVAAAPGKHPCQKPIQMYEHIIRASSRPGDLVLDPFAGSGVAGEACRRLGRDCILIERDPHWFARLDRPHAPGPIPSRKSSRAYAETPLFATLEDAPHDR